MPLDAFNTFADWIESFARPYEPASRDALLDMACRTLADPKRRAVIGPGSQTWDALVGLLERSGYRATRNDAIDDAETLRWFVDGCVEFWGGPLAAKVASTKLKRAVSGRVAVDEAATLAFEVVPELRPPDALV